MNKQKLWRPWYLGVSIYTTRKGGYSAEALGFNADRFFYTGRSPMYVEGKDLNVVLLTFIHNIEKYALSVGVTEINVSTNGYQELNAIVQRLRRANKLQHPWTVGAVGDGIVLEPEKFHW